MRRIFNGKLLLNKESFEYFRISVHMLASGEDLLIHYISNFTNFILK
jgi:hypothetical protein